VVQAEFLSEHRLLTRLSHPNIVQILGAGVSPRCFVVVEFLGGGLLTHVVSRKPKLSLMDAFKTVTQVVSEAILLSRKMALALRYMHRVAPGAVVIHRDLKPENIGFTTSGELKLFDFGLATCVEVRRDSETAYNMTGNTGSLRYMAPEVALQMPYTEKVDVYSFALISWQMARRKVPFKGLNTQQFVQSVVRDGMRPPIEKAWPLAYQDLLARSWHELPAKRPSFDQVCKVTTDKA
jgi:serine/threonine protein kinase